MIPVAFDYVAPESVEDALAILAEAGDDAKVMAGGQSLLPVLRLRLNSPEKIVDLGRIAALTSVTDEGDHLLIGSMVTHSDVIANDLVKEHALLLHETVKEVADPQVRHRGTLGGALVHADPAGDVGAVALALEVEFVIAGPGGATRTVPASEFFVDLFETAVQEGELLTGIKVPKHTGWGAHYEKFVRVAHQWAIVAVAATVKVEGGTISEARIGLTNMGSTPLRASSVEAALVGQPATEEAVKAAAASAADGTNPPSDLNGDSDYRKHLATVLTRRAVLAAAGAEALVDLHHSFTVPADVDTTWATFMDLEGVAGCFPGAAVTGVDGDSFTGTVKVKLGPIALVYGGKGTFVERDDAAHRAVIEASGKDKRGNGTAGANVTIAVAPSASGGSDVDVTTDLNVTGKPAQFGRGVMQDVSDKLLGQFVACLEQRFAAAPEASSPEAGAVAAEAEAAPGSSAPEMVAPAGSPAPETASETSEETAPAALRSGCSGCAAPGSRGSCGSAHPAGDRAAPDRRGRVRRRPRPRVGGPAGDPALLRPAPRGRRRGPGRRHPHRAGHPSLSRHVRTPRARATSPGAGPWSCPAAILLPCWLRSHGGTWRGSVTGSRRVADVLRGDEAVAALDTSGFWAVVATFEGDVTAVRFADVGPATTLPLVPDWAPLDGAWLTSLDETAYVGAVEEVRRRIAAGEVYQANVCRVLEHPLADDADLDGLEAVLRVGNPAPYAARIRVTDAGIDLVSASPELYLRRDGRRLVSGPVKGTAPTLAQMLPKDVAENVMIVDLVRNDLSHVCEPGTVDVEQLCRPVTHPGLVHLESTVAGRLRDGATWREVLAASFPPGSVSGAPKSSALDVIHDLEPVPRGPYCGAIGWVDADRGEARLAVGIRTFWAQADARGVRQLRFGAGAGITWGSDPAGEWQETELKAARLVALASGRAPVSPAGGR